jgi:hypothetical protein
VSNSTSISQTQLFTEMTAEEGATLSGGAVSTYFNLKYFVVRDTQETKDEPYLKRGNTTIWSATGVTENQYNVGYNFWLNGGNEVLRLWEDDGSHWYDGNDFLGEHTLYAGESGTNKKASFTKDGANYELVYDAVSYYY